MNLQNHLGQFLFCLGLLYFYRESLLIQIRFNTKLIFF